MSGRIKPAFYKCWRIFFLLFTITIYTVYLFDPFKISLWPYAHSLVYRLAPFLLISYFLFRKLTDGVELKLLVLFFLWILISRFINAKSETPDDLFLISNAQYYLICFVAPFLCSRESRLKFLDCIAILSVVVFTVLSIIAIYTAITNIVLPNPFAPESSVLAIIGNQTRLNMFERNPNTVCAWFFMGIIFSIYLFFRCKSQFRYLFLLTITSNHLGLALTYSRNGMLCSAVCYGILIIIVLYNKISSKKTATKILLLALAFCVSVLAGYKSFEAARSIIGKMTSAAGTHASSSGICELSTYPHANTIDVYVSTLGLCENNSEEHINDVSPLDVDNVPKSGYIKLSANNTADYSNDRGLVDTGRLPIWKKGFELLKKDPIRLLRGCNFYEKKEAGSFKYNDYHNTFLEILIISGLPGFILLFAFLLILAIKCFKIIFSTNPQVPSAVKITVLPIVAVLIYSFFETILFIVLSVRDLPFFLCAGTVISYYKDLFDSTKAA